MHSIEVLNLSKSFQAKQIRPEIPALDNVSFSCDSGLIYGLLGPNGSGKTTCLRILSGIIRPTAGLVKVAGVDAGSDYEKVRHKVGYVSSTARPYNHLTAKEFLIFCAQLAQIEKPEPRISALMRQLGIEQFQDRYCGELSTGMNQRVAIARALVYEPEVLIFDEATVGLDILGRREVLDLLATLRSSGRTIICSTHIPEEAEELCDVIMVFSRGRLVAKGTIHEIMAHSEAGSLEEACRKLFTL